MAKTVSIEKKFNVKVTGVYADLPANSSVRPEYIISFSTLEHTENIKRNDLYAGDCMNFALLQSGVDPRVAENKIRNLFSGYKGLEYEELQLCPLSKIHLSHNGRNDYYIILGIFALIGAFILIMSAFNYVSLTIARASTRGKEVAIKKINGGTQSSLVFQFLCETTLLSAVSVIFSFGLVKLLLPVYNSIVNATITIDFVRDWKFAGLLIGISLIIGLCSGLYPAFFMSSHKIINLFKGSIFKTGKGSFGIRQILVTAQFSISVFLICLSLFFVSQVNYMINKDLGFNKEHLLYVKLTSSAKDKNFDDLRSRLLQNPEIVDASMSRNLPFVNYNGGLFNWEGGAPDEKINCRPNYVSYDFVKNMGITILQGRDFSREYPSDIGRGCLINETALRCFGWDNPVGKRINNNEWTVVGVVKDYHFKNMHNSIEPVILILNSGEMTGEWSFAFRYTPGKRDKVRQILEAEFSNLFPNDPFEFHDLATSFLYEKTIKLYYVIKKSILFFTVFNILLAVIGLLGLVSFTTIRRTKEIGIRKINGSTVREIFFLLNHEFMVMLAISLLLAWPSAYMVYKVLPGSYKLSPQLWIPLLSAFIILMIVLITTCWQTYRAATRNPVESLRYE
ncbi:MAG TPA: FtsX-like permease family protein [Bacteroidales bacterium]|nr:FtsX-like permease family protein [Bacteroidales bacterium]